MGQDPAQPACFSLVDALDGLFRLEKRSPTLGGSVPLRVAQACLPLLEGNAFGFQVSLTQRWRLERGPLGWRLTLTQDEQAQLIARYALARQRLVAAGYLQPSSRWLQVLEDEVLFGRTPQRRLGPLIGKQLRLRLWTGLLVRPDPGLSLRLFGTANRRQHSFTVTEQCLQSQSSLLPLILDLTLAPGAADARTLSLGGELACLAPLPTTVHFDRCTLAEQPAVGLAHAAFYDPSYFKKKSARPTRRYRRQIDSRPDPASAASADCQVVVAGPTELQIASDPALPSSQQVHFANLLDFRCRFDGASVSLDFDRQALHQHGQALWQQFRHQYGDRFVAEHEGALLYLSKYFTTHPPGEPHFFVKPWAFVRTPPGWSSLIDGSHGDGYDVLRGVIATDQFHAAPAVFAIHRSDAELTVPAGAPLSRIFPLPRTLLQAGFRRLALG